MNLLKGYFRGGENKKGNFLKINILLGSLYAKNMISIWKIVNSKYYHEILPYMNGKKMHLSSFINKLVVMVKI